MAPISTLRLLSNIISEAVDTIEGVYADAGVTPPSLDAPFNPQDPLEALRSKPEVMAATLKIVAAAGQIGATARDPVLSALNSAHAFQISACLRTASELNVVEILREAGPQGLHVKDIAAPSSVSPDLLARILRLLATHHIFREVAPGIFANNRISSTLDKGKLSAVLFEKREDRLTGTSGVAALAEFIGDECFKSSSFLTDALLDPAGEQNPLTRAFGLKEPMFNWFMQPENRHRVNRFALAMHGTAASEPLELIFNGYDWSQLPDGAVLVDVGGGLGSSSMAIAKKYPSFRVVNQDLAPTIEDAKPHWDQHFPEHVQRKMVELQAHDFFEPQPVKDADVFMLRHVVHDWSDERTVKMLQRLRDVAKPTTQLVIIENIMPLVSGAESDIPRVKSIPGAIRSPAPSPLLPNYGVSSAQLYYYDITVHNLIGGGERTVEGFSDVLEESGWKLVQIHRCPGSEQCHIVGTPI
ncbi:O-methyltransferase [Mycena galericulata]|nr:O-methyltransferase [Mycena galericulata]